MWSQLTSIRFPKIAPVNQHMSHEEKGSKPGPVQLIRTHSIPPVEFTIPQDIPEQVITKCPSRPIRSRGSQDKSADPDRLNDEERQSVILNGNEVSYPEGGLAAWLVVSGAFTAVIASFGMMNTVGIFQQYLSDHQLKDYSESTVGWIFGIYVFLSFFCGIQIGPIFDVHGPRMLVLAGAILLSVSMFLLGICTRKRITPTITARGLTVAEYWHFLIVFGIIGGLGTSLIFTPAFAAIGHFFLEKRAYATGIAAAGGSLGGVIFPLALQQLFPKVGFAWATRILGFIFVCTTGIGVLLIRSRLPPKVGQRSLPNLMIFKDSAFTLLTLGTFFMEWGLFVPITYISSFATSTGALDPAFSYQLMAIFNAGSCLGRWAPGYMADKLGRFNSMIFTLVLCCATTFTFWLPATLLPSHPDSAGYASTVKGLVIVYAVIFGFASGSNISLTPVCVGQLCETNVYGTYYATCYTIVSFGTLTGIPIAGALIQAAGGKYYGVVVFTGLCYVGSLACFICARGIKVGWKLGIKF